MNYKPFFEATSTRLPLDQIENKFAAHTGASLKSVLHNLFIEQDKTKHEISEMFGVTEGVIKRFLIAYELKKVRTRDTSKKFSKTPKDIEKEMNRKFIDIVHDLMNQGLSPTEITRKLELGEQTAVSSVLGKARMKLEMQNADTSEYLLPDLKGKAGKTVEWRLYKELRINYKEWLHQKYIVEGLSAADITKKYLGVGLDSLRRTLKYYGLSKTVSQARQDAIKSGAIDYKTINSKARKTRNKSNGSNKQDTFRDLLKYYFEQHFSNDPDIELIMGYNEFGILKDKEVDIPIIIIHKNKYNKYSIEYSGEFWHQDDKAVIRDTDKQQRLINKGWKHFVIVDPKNGSETYSKLEDKAKETAMHIINDFINT